MNDDVDVDVVVGPTDDESAALSRNCWPPTPATEEEELSWLFIGDIGIRITPRTSYRHLLIFFHFSIRVAWRVREMICLLFTKRHSWGDGLRMR